MILTKGFNIESYKKIFKYSINFNLIMCVYIIMCKIVKFQKFIWQNLIKLAKIQMSFIYMYVYINMTYIINGSQIAKKKKWVN